MTNKYKICLNLILLNLILLKIIHLNTTHPNIIHQKIIKIKLLSLKMVLKYFNKLLKILFLNWDFLLKIKSLINHSKLKLKETIKDHHLNPEPKEIIILIKNKVIRKSYNL